VTVGTGVGVAVTVTVGTGVGVAVTVTVGTGVGGVETLVPFFQIRFLPDFIHL
jgi:hypothetical protein